MAETKDPRVQLKVDVPKSLDRALEMESTRRDITKRQFVEEALRVALKLAKAA